MKPLSEGYTITASHVFKLSVIRFRSFLECQYSAAYADEIITAIKANVARTLPTNPYLAPISERLLNLGVADYRQWLIDDFNLVFYRVDEVNQRIELLALMSAKQSIRKLLFEVNLLI